MHNTSKNGKNEMSKASSKNKIPLNPSYPFQKGIVFGIQHHWVT